MADLFLGRQGATAIAYPKFNIRRDIPQGDPHHGKYGSWDPYGWLEGDTYYAIFGGKRLAIVKSKSLEGPWKYVGDLFAHTVGDVSIDEDVSCADFFKLGNKHMLLGISHRLGVRYYLGEWKNEQFYPEFHEQMSWVTMHFSLPKVCWTTRAAGLCLPGYATPEARKYTSKAAGGEP